MTRVEPRQSGVVLVYFTWYIFVNHVVLYRSYVLRHIGSTGGRWTIPSTILFRRSLSGFDDLKKKTKKKNRKVVGYGWIYFKNLFSSDKMLLVWILVKRKAEAYGFSNWSYLERVSLFCEWRSCFGHRSLGKQSVRHHKYVVLLQNSTSGLVHALSWPCVCSCWPWSGAHLLGKRTSVW